MRKILIIIILIISSGVSGITFNKSFNNGFTDPRDEVIYINRPNVIDDYMNIPK
jgi:hypothetical protein